MANPLNLVMYVVGGGVVGYLYYRLIGCSSSGCSTGGALPGAAKDGIRAPGVGVCPITSRLVPSIIYGAVMGAILASSR